MAENTYSDQAFADRISIELKGETVSASSVRKWRLGVSMPRRTKLVAIGNVTAGVVTAESFAQAEGPNG